MAKYSAADLKALGAQGQAFKNPDGDWSLPIADKDDLTSAIHAVGLAKGDHDPVRKYIIGRAKSLGESDLIPDNWNADGSLAEANAVSRLAEFRRKKAEALTGTRERRQFETTGRLELRDATDDSGLRLTGWASITGISYQVGSFRETVQPGAFKRTLSQAGGPDVQLLINHGSGGSGMPLARTKSGTMRLTEITDSKTARAAEIDDWDGTTGLWVDAELDPADPDVQLLNRKMRRGDINQMSFAFTVPRGGDSWSDDWTDRSISELSIHQGDVSVVNQGASPTTNAAIRSEDALRGLQSFGPEGLIVALTEWRAHTLLPVEERAGKTLSAASMEVLTKVLELVQRSDDAVDEAIPMLADLMGVPNPDADDGTGKPEQSDAGPDGEPDPPVGSTQPDGRSWQAKRRRQALLAGMVIR